MGISLEILCMLRSYNIVANSFLSYSRPYLFATVNLSRNTNVCRTGPQCLQAYCHNISHPFIRCMCACVRSTENGISKHSHIPSYATHNTHTHNMKNPSSESFHSQSTYFPSSKYSQNIHI